jgi:hypothetical protein
MLLSEENHFVHVCCCILRISKDEKAEGIRAGPRMREAGPLKDHQGNMETPRRHGGQGGGPPQEYSVPSQTTRNVDGLYAQHLENSRRA